MNELKVQIILSNTSVKPKNKMKKLCKKKKKKKKKKYYK